MLFRDNISNMSSLGYVSGYVKKFIHLVQLERDAEMIKHEKEIKTLSGRERERKGRALLNMRGKKTGTGLGGRIHVKYSKKGEGTQLPEHEISVGDLVMLSKKDPLNPDNPTATVTEKTTYSLTLAFDSTPPPYLLKGTCRIDLYVNDVTYQRMLEALKKVDDASGRLKKLTAVLLGFKAPSFNPVKSHNPINQKLNRYQMQAVQKALMAKDIYLIHGPPGTGKTVSAVELIHQSVEAGNRILACADSNVAVDNILEKLVESGVKAVRVGHPARVTPLLREHTLDSMIEDNPRYLQVRQLRDKAFQLIEERHKQPYPHMRWRRGMSDNKILRLASQGAGSRGVSGAKIKEMAKWVKLQQKIDAFFDGAQEKEREIIEQILQDADVVCTTNSTAGSELMQERSFDLLVLDEATQSTEPSALIPLVCAKKVVLAGDHKQLPPTVLNQEAKRLGLSQSLFERLMRLHDDKIRSVLRIQYRMHADIMDFSNKAFYNGALIAHDSVKNHRLGDLGYPEGANPVIYLDTSDECPKEKTRMGSTSKINPLEADYIKAILRLLLNAGVPPADIGVISPYDDQVNLLRMNNPIELRDELEIKTVDGFQGREKQVIIVSFVRSNPGGDIGFLSDLRRLNVSLTRAKRKLILVGDSKTLSKNKTYQNLIKYLHERASVYIRLEDFRI